MQKRFIRNLALLLSLNLLIKPFWILGIDRAVQNAVGDADYGFFFSVFSYSFLFFILLDLGITNYNNRNIARNNHLLSMHFAGITVLKLMLSLLYFIVVFAIGILIGYNQQQLYILAWMAANAVMLSFILYLRSNISGLLMFKTDSLLSVLDRLLMILICSVLLWSGLFTSPFRIEWFIYAQTAAYTITLMVALLIVLKYAGTLKLRFDTRFMLTIIRRSLPYAVLVLLMSFYNRLEPVLIERILGGERGFIQTGIYGKAFRLFDAGNNISLLFSVLLLPMFATMIKKRESILQLTKLSFSIIISVSLIVAILSQFYSTQLMELLYPLREGETPDTFFDRIALSSKVFQLLMLSFAAVSVTYIFGTLLTANGNLRVLNVIAASAVAINLLLNFALIPRFEAMGAAVSSLSVQAVTAIVQFWVARKIFQLHFGKAFWIRLLSFTVIILIVSILSCYLLFDWKINFLLSFVICVTMIFVTRILSLKNLWELMASAKDRI